jgi:hypothetical protein
MEELSIQPPRARVAVRSDFIDRCIELADGLLGAWLIREESLGAAAIELCPLVRTSERSGRLADRLLSAATDQTTSSMSDLADFVVAYRNGNIRAIYRFYAKG